MRRRQMVRRLAWQQNGLLPWHSRMILWSHLRGHPFGHGQICRLRMMVRQAVNEIQ